MYRMTTIDYIEQNSANFDSNRNTPEIRIYKRRFWILFLYSSLAFLSGLIYPQYASMTDMNTCYYGVSNSALNWTSTMYMIVYFFLAFPASSLIERIDLRKTVILGSVFNTIGCALQFTGLKPSGFPFVLLSTVVCTLPYLVILGTPPFVAAKWFPINELARACAIGAAGNQLGVGFAFILSPLMVTSDCEKKEEIEDGKRNVAIILTASNVALLILILLTFQNAPKCPPSINEYEKTSKQPLSNRMIILKMLKNVHFILISIVFGLMFGIFMAFLTFLNNLMLHYFPNKQVEIGWMGLLFVITGQVGSVLAGWFLDYARKYKETFLGICIFSFVMYIVFSILLFAKLIWVQFLMIALLGFFLSGLAPIGFEYAIEVTYPDSEVISGNLLMTFTNLFGLILTHGILAVLDTKGPIWSNVLTSVIILICCIISSFITKDYKRTKDNEEKMKKEITDLKSKPTFPLEINHL